MKDSISVIIPTFCRTVNMLNNAVQSVKKQTIPVDEIIIVDDNKNTSLSENILLYCQKKGHTYKASGNADSYTLQTLPKNSLV